MMEVIRHSLGLCGEGHPSLLLFLGGGFAAAAMYFSSFKFWVLSLFKRGS